MVDRAILFFLFLLTASLPFSIAATHVCLGVLFLLGGYQYGIQRRPFIHTPLDWPIGLYLLVVLTAGLVGFSPSKSLLNIAAHWHIALYLMVANWVPNRTVAIRLIGVLLGVGALNGLYGIVQHLSGGLDLFQQGHEIAYDAGGQVRATGTFSHYMTFSGQMFLMALFGTGLLVFWARGKAFWILATVVMILIGGVLSSWTRNAWLGLVAGMLVIGWLKGRKAFAILIVSLTLSIILLLIFYPGLKTRVVSITNLTTDQSNLERIRIWQTTLEMIQDHPLLGVGIGNYKAVMDQYRDRYGAGLHSAAHNSLLQQTAQNGLIGLAGFIFIWYVFFREGIRNTMGSSDPFIRGVTAGALGALAGFHIAGMFEHSLGDSEVAMMMWFIAGSAMAVRSLDMSERPKAVSSSHGS